MDVLAVYTTSMRQMPNWGMKITLFTILVIPETVDQVNFIGILNLGTVFSSDSCIACVVQLGPHEKTRNRASCIVMVSLLPFAARRVCIF